MSIFEFEISVIISVIIICVLEFIFNKKVFYKGSDHDRNASRK